MENFIKGVDLSTLIELEKCGARYFDQGKEEDVLTILKRYDIDSVRVRLWNDPYSEKGEPYGAGTNDIKTTMEILKKTRSLAHSTIPVLTYWLRQ